MKQTIYKNGGFLTLDKKIPTMKAMLVTDGIITASAEAFILEDIAPDAQVIDMKGGTMIPAFIETYSSFLDKARRASASDSQNDLISIISELSDYYLKNGITTASNARTSKEDLELLMAADAAGALSIDIAVYLKPDAADVIPKNIPVDNTYSGHIRFAGMSVFADIYSSEKELTRIFSQNIRNHWQSAVEANQTAAIEKVINSYCAALIEVNGSKTDEDGNVKPKIYEDLRPLLCGGAHLADNQLTRLQALGFTPCFNTDLIYTEGDKYINTLPAEQADNIFPARSIVRRGMAFSLTHDRKDMDPIMLDTIYTAVNRITSSGHVLGEEQSINSDQAVNSISLFAAYQIFEDLSKGSLTPGKKSDFIIVNKNPLELSDANLSSLSIKMVVKGDKIIYID